MADSSTTLGIGSGLARGLASVLLNKRQQDTENQRIAEQRNADLHMALLPEVLKRATSYEDVSGFIDQIAGVDSGSGKKKGKKGEPDHHAVLQDLLGPLLQQNTAAPSASGAPEDVAGVESQITGQPAAAPPSPPQTLMGVPVLSDEELATRNNQAKIDQVKRAWAQLKQIDPTTTLADAAQFVANGMFPRDYASTAAGITSVPGQMPDGKAAYGVFDRRPNSPTYGRYLDPDTQEPLVGFQPRTTTGSTFLGADREALAKQMFGKTAKELSGDEMAQVNAKLPEFAQSMAKGRGLGAGEAKITTDLNAPIGTTAGVQYNVPPTTTLKELSDTVGLTPEQQQKIASLSQVDVLLKDIETGIDKVFPTVEPGIRGRLQSQFTIGMKRFAADEDLASLDSAIQGALALAVQLEGQPGGRISDADIKIAKSTLAELTPRIFGGDTRATAQARLAVLRQLFDKAQTTVVVPRPTAAAPRATTPAVAPTGAVIRDGQLYINGTLVGAP